jgi:hypothetical protein
MRLLLFLVLILAMAPSLGMARTSYKLPPGARLQIAQGTVQSYSLEEMKILLKMDVDLEAYEKEIPKYKKSLEDYGKIVESMSIMLKSKDVQIDTLTKERVRITEKWSQENKLRHECENSPRIGSWVAWSIAGVATVTAICLGVILAVDKNQ